MKTIQMKKSAFISTIVAVSLLFGSVGVMASNGLEKITANLNHNIKFKIDGGSWTPKDPDGNKMAPIIYEGSTYLPARAIAEAIDAEVKWDGDTQTITINTNGGSANDGIPYKDDPNYGTTQPKPQNPNPPKETPKDNGSTTVSKAKGTFSDPVKLGETFTYTDKVNYSDVTIANLSVTVNSAKPITLKDIEALGLRSLDEEGEFDYLMVDLSIKASDVSYSKGNGEGLGFAYLSNVTPSIWGSKTKEGRGLIGGMNYGFEGSISEVMRDSSASSVKMTYGDSGKSYSIRGKVILPVIKGSDSYLVLRNQDSNIEYDNSFYYFKLK